MSVQPDSITGNKKFDQMTDPEFRAALMRIVRTSESETQIRQGLIDLGCPYAPSISWREPTAANAMVSVMGALAGGALSQTRAMVMVDVYGPSGEVISV
jgi:hypothetical protein